MYNKTVFKILIIAGHYEQNSVLILKKKKKKKKLIYIPIYEMTLTAILLIYIL